MNCMLCLDFKFNMYLSNETVIMRKSNVIFTLNFETIVFIIQIVSPGFAIMVKIPYPTPKHDKYFICYSRLTG